MATTLIQRSVSGMPDSVQQPVSGMMDTIQRPLSGMVTSTQRSVSGAVTSTQRSVSGLAALTPQTPTSRVIASSTQQQPPPPSPGTWRHPKFTEIIARQSASTFSDRNLRRAVANFAALVASFLLSSPITTTFNATSTALTIPYPDVTTFYTLFFLRLFLLVNIGLAFRPLFLSSKDQITDIPLTPSQRSLLGLDPSLSSTPATPQSEGYITPPRYRRSSGSFSSTSGNSPTATTDRRSISATYYPSSPLSALQNFSPGTSGMTPFRSTPRSAGLAGGSPFSPSASPLLQKAMAVKNNNREMRESGDGFDRRQSFSTSGSGLGRSQSLRERGATGAESPSPSGRARRTPGMNYKWLYEKGVRLPRSETMQF